MIDITIGIIFYSFVAVFTIWFSFKQKWSKEKSKQYYNKRVTFSYGSSDPYYCVLQFSKIIYFNL